MPDRQTHVKHCKKLYGYGFNEIHAWMDGTVRSKGIKHRIDRHDPYRTPDKAYEIFKSKVPQQYKKFIKDAVKDHIELDERGQYTEQMRGPPEGRKPKSHTRAKKRKARRLMREGRGFWETWSKSGLGFFSMLSVWFSYNPHGGPRDESMDDYEWFEKYPEEGVKCHDGIVRRRPVRDLGKVQGETKTCKECSTICSKDEEVCHFCGGKEFK